MKKHKKWTVLIMALLTVLAIVPVQSARAADGDYTFAVAITYYGSEPTPITVYIGEQSLLNAYTITHTFVFDPQWDNFNTATYTYKLSINVDAPAVSTTNKPFAAVSLDSVEGKWYVDKWDWNNWIYQPGAYMVKPDKDINFYSASFFLTSSAPTNNSITINRTWAADAPPVDTEFVLFKHYDKYDKNIVYKNITIPKDQTSVTVSGLYAGTYYVTNLYKAAHYTDDATEFFDCYYPYANYIWRDESHITAYGQKAVLTGNTSASVSFVDSYPPTNSISVAALSGGTITPNVTKSIPGDTISLTVTPDANRQIKAGTLKYSDSLGDHLISGTSFTMPDGPVTVSAEFEPKQYTVSVSALTDGSITPDKTAAASGDMVNLTITPSAGKELRPGTLSYTYGSTTVPITGTSFEMPQSNVTISAQFQTLTSITTTALPDGMKGNSYSATVSAQDGLAPYTWSAQGLPVGLSIDAGTGEISGTPTENGSFDVTLTVTDTGGTTSEKTLSLYINDQCGNGAYLITPDTSANYSWGYGDGGLPAMTVGSGVSGFRTFSVSVEPGRGHTGDEALLFVHMRDGEQIGISANFADYDTITTAKAAFNVKPDDVIKVYIVDDLSSDAGQNPNIL